MNILITGSTGFIGNAIVGKLKSKDTVTIGIERDLNRRHNTTHCVDITVKGDIRNYDFIRRVISDYEIEEVYHCAAQAIVKSCANDPYTTYEINIMGTVALLEACRNSGGTIKSIVVSTSDKSFGHAPAPYTEETPLMPLYTYETSKACQQMITLSYFHNYELPTKVVACSNVYGPCDPNLSRIIPNTIRRLHNGEPAMLNNGVKDYVREFVYVDDVADAFIAVSRHGSSGHAYCCGGTDYCTIYDLICKICNMMDKDPAQFIKVFERAKNFKEINKQWINASKLKKLGWCPQTNLDEGLKECIKYYTSL